MNYMVTDNRATEIDYQLAASQRVVVTSEAGDKLSDKDNVAFQDGVALHNVVRIHPEATKQTLLGIGTSFTEASAFVLAHLDPAVREGLLRKVFSEEGANFALARTHIGSCDFTVNGKYSYADAPGAEDLQNFSITTDLDGFLAQDFPDIKDPHFDLLPMIKNALAIKQEQPDRELRIVASAWTAPPWMKDIEKWFQPGGKENGFNGTGGKLKPEYVATYADYLVRYLEAYQQEGVSIWGLTPVNEPTGNNGQWESMHFTAQEQNDFVKRHLGPKLKASNRSDVRLLVYDHNRDHLEEWADVIFADSETAEFVYGAAIHWYESTYKVAEDVLEKVHQKYPGFSIIHTEGCIDDLGKDAPPGIQDPERFKETNWFKNDVFWWNDNATDWAYTATWQGVKADDHPIYTPVHRYARNIIESFNHWVTGWIDWNIVLDRQGGPNHVGNYCGAPIMIDLDSGEIHYTPVFYTLAQFSRTIRPGDKVVQVDEFKKEAGQNTLHVCASKNSDNLLSIQILNTRKEPQDCQLQIGAQWAQVQVQANCLQTIQVQL